MHNPLLHRLLAQSRLDDLRRAGEASARLPGPRLEPRPAPVGSPVTLRFGFPDDAEAIARLASLDSSVPPPQPLLLAEIAGELRAVLSLSDRSVIADPFYPSAAVVELLRARADQLVVGSRRPGRGRLRVWARLRPVTWR